MPEPPYRRVHVIVNPASGRDEPVLNVLNDVFRQFDVDWDVSVTHRYGDAARQARKAIEDGVDLVAGYGGDGTQHEIANAAHGGECPDRAPDTDGHPARRHRQRVRPGDGRAEHPARGHRGPLHQHGHPSRRRRPASRPRAGRDDPTATSSSGCMSASSPRSRRVASSRIGTASSATWSTSASHARDTTAVHYRTDLDGEAIEFDAERVYVINSGMMGTGLKITQTYAIDDGLLDCFMIDRRAASDAGGGGHPTAGSAGHQGHALPPPVPHASGSRPSPTRPCGPTASTWAARPSPSTSSPGP